MAKRIDAKGDLAFKKVFGTIGNEDILAGLVQDFFGFTPSAIVITNPYDIKVLEKALAGTGESYPRLAETLGDVGATMLNGEFAAEMQVRNQSVYGARSLYYAFSRFCDNYGKDGARYGALRPVYALNVLSEPYFKGDDIAARLFRLYDPELGMPMDREYLQAAYFELPKTDLRGNEGHALWRKYFLGEELPEYAPQYLKKAAGIIEYVNLREEERQMLNFQEKFLADQETYIMDAKAEERAVWQDALAAERAEKEATLAEVAALRALLGQQGEEVK